MKESTLEKLAKEYGKKWSEEFDRIEVERLQIMMFRPKERTARDLLDVIF